jgi:hypothetical protein
MAPIWSKETDEILGVGQSLSHIGVRNWMLTRSQALIAIEELEAEGIAVLGGDVYSAEEGRVAPTYDSWHCDRNPGENDEAFVRRSAERARRYIGEYPATGGGRVGFAIVPRVARQSPISTSPPTDG